jgi:hypothetical protein
VGIAERRWHGTVALSAELTDNGVRLIEFCSDMKLTIATDVVPEE